MQNVAQLSLHQKQMSLELRRSYVNRTVSGMRQQLLQATEVALLFPVMDHQVLGRVFACSDLQLLQAVLQQSFGFINHSTSVKMNLMWHTCGIANHCSSCVVKAPCSWYMRQSQA